MEKENNENKFYVYAYLDPRKPGKYIYGEYSFYYEPFYIGKGFGNRKNVHLNENKNNTTNRYKFNKIQKIIREINENPIIILIEFNLTEKQSFILETKYIQTIGRLDFKVGPLTNLTNGGDGPSGQIHSEETRNKISKSKIGEKNPMFGKTPSDKTKQKMSDNSYMKKLSNEERKEWGKKYSGENNSNYGNHLSDDVKKKISIANSGKNSANYGKKFSTEKRKKDSEAKIGEKNPMFGKKGALSPNIKTFKVTNPYGEIFYTTNGLTEFCSKNNLSIKNMSAVARGKRNHHKGWMCELIESPSNKK